MQTQSDSPAEACASRPFRARTTDMELNEPLSMSVDFSMPCLNADAFKFRQRLL